MTVGRLASHNGVPENRIVRSHFCTELSYLLNKRSGEYHALFNDPSSDEKFDPVGGVPRPVSDPAVRTKYFSVPSGLQADYPERVTPSRFSGKMREAAGCYYARGADIPFRHGYEKTHGIVWSTNALGTELAPMASVAGSNVGNGTFGPITAGPGAKSGDFLITMTSAGPTAGFSVIDPEGVALSAGAIGTAYSGGGLGFTIADGGVDFAVGDAFTVTVVGTGRYWLVEVSAQGVFATRVKVGGDCCSSWSVQHLMPTDEEIKKSPGLREYRSKVSLSWYRTARGGGLVKQLLGPEAIAPAYQNGAPWTLEHGWAFSASGAEAQTVVISTGSSPADHYLAARFKVGFRVSGTDVITASFSTMERDRKFTLVRNRAVWSPVVPGLWNGATGPSGNESPNPLELIPSQDAPIHVFYAGETPKITRWSLTWTNQPAVNGKPSAAYAPGPNVPAGYTCVYDPMSSAMQLFSGSDIAAHKDVNSGFSGPGFNYAGHSYSRSVSSKSGHRGASVTTHYGPFGNFFTLKPECYFIYGDPPQLVTQCSQTYTVDWTHSDFWDEIENTTDAETFTSSVILFMEEREAILAVVNHTQSSSGTRETGNGTSIRTHETVTKVSSSHGGACPGYSYDIEVGSGSGGEPASDHASASAVNDSSADPAATLALGGFGVSIALSVTPGFNEISDQNFQTFLECGPLKSTAESAVFAMKGNINDANRAYRLSTMVVEGGFLYTSGEVIGYVGKV